MTLNVFEITQELIEMYPALREAEKLSEGMKIDVSAEQALELQTVEIETVSSRAES